MERFEPVVPSYDFLWFVWPVWFDRLCPPFPVKPHGPAFFSWFDFFSWGRLGVVSTGWGSPRVAWQEIGRGMSLAPLVEEDGRREEGPGADGPGVQAGSERTRFRVRLTGG